MDQVMRVRVEDFGIRPEVSHNVSELGPERENVLRLNS